MEYNINPIPKPRMTRSDAWKKRPCVERYWDFKEKIKLNKVKIEECNYHIIFILPMPKSWSNKKKLTMFGKPHQQIPDKDNLEKAILDAVYENDSHIWDGQVSKIWGYQGKIIIKTIPPIIIKTDGNKIIID